MSKCLIVESFANICLLLLVYIDEGFLLIDSVYKQTLSYTNIANLQVSMIAGDNI